MFLIFFFLPFRASLACRSNVGTSSVAVAKENGRILDRWAGANFLQRAPAPDRNSRFCGYEQQDCAVAGEGEGGHPDPILAGRRQVCRNSAIRYDSISQCPCFRRHHDMGADAKDAARGAGRAEEIARRNQDFLPLTNNFRK